MLDGHNSILPTLKIILPALKNMLAKINDMLTGQEPAYFSFSPRSAHVL